MARGGRHRGGRGGGGGQQAFQIIFDSIGTNSIPPYLINGILTISGNHIAVMNALQNFNPQTVSQSPQMMMPGMNLNTEMPMGFGEQSMNNPMLMMQPMQMSPVPNPTVNQLNITVVGAKTNTFGTCCYTMTVVSGSFCILPLFFMCCPWWKKIVYPQYEINPQFYRSLGRFLQRNRQCNNITLTVIDNGFDRQKCNILYESFQGAQLTGLTFLNRALCLNYKNNQASDFIENVTPIKSLPFTSVFTWDDMLA